MPPLQGKKTVAKFNPDTTRIFSNYDTRQATSAKSHSQSTHAGQRHPAGKKSRIIGPPIQNTPHPADVSFLRQDCHLLHEPICHVKTKVKVYSEDDKHWWPSRTYEASHKVPKYSDNSTSRADFKKSEKPVHRQTRHGTNPHTTAAQGIVPVNHLPAQNGPRLCVERISYEHGYDSRKPTNQPQRGKLHGNFVWDVLHPVEPSPVKPSAVRKTSSSNWTRSNSFPWENATSSPQAKMVQVSSTMAVLKPVTETSNARKETVGLGTVGNANSLASVASVLSMVAS